MTNDPIKGGAGEIIVKYVITSDCGTLVSEAFTLTVEVIENGIDAEIVNRVEEARPNILDVIRNKQVDIVINTPTKGNDSTRDGFKIRRTAIEFSTEIMTSLDTLKALVEVKKKQIADKELMVYNIVKEGDNLKIEDTLIYHQANNILKEIYGVNASFRDGQYEAIESIFTKKRTAISN